MKHNLVIWRIWFMDDSPTADTNTHPSVCRCTATVQCFSQQPYLTIRNVAMTRRGAAARLTAAHWAWVCYSHILRYLPSYAVIFTILITKHLSWHSQTFILKGKLWLYTLHFKRQTAKILSQRRTPGCKFGNVWTLKPVGKLWAKNLNVHQNVKKAVRSGMNAPLLWLTISAEYDATSYGGKKLIQRNDSNIESPVGAA